MRTVVQISLDVTTIPEALALARVAVEAGVDWLEAGTPLIIAEGMHGVRAVRQAFPTIPLVADLKTMDGGYLEAELMAHAGATHVVVMERAHEETVTEVVRAGRALGLRVMGDTLGAADKVAAARRLEALGCDYIIHHIGYDERRGLAARGLPVGRVAGRGGRGRGARAGGGRPHAGAGAADAGLRGAARGARRAAHD